MQVKPPILFVVLITAQHTLTQDEHSKLRPHHQSTRANPPKYQLTSPKTAFLASGTEGPPPLACHNQSNGAFRWFRKK